jgi:hypothetical protein
MLADDRPEKGDGSIVCDMFLVPVRTTKAGTLALRTGRLLTGERIGLAFTSEASLLLAMGPSQQWTRLGYAAMRDMLAPLGIKNVRIDPHPISELGAGGPAIARGLGLRRQDFDIDEPNAAHPVGHAAESRP